ncbi:hypothetical protein DMN91_006120 [Ooceraea biroi]|uniref:DUF7041 domain-containing protein n=1 Tax=Ooceraea biroi TaxID=2015173 RepID=A0A3L8DMT5_OOCBI|nr:uncharacterized protein LOC105277133 [Ooceraea biroi]RLU21744.1 hypothetical protein DMN91_006120 [Ooceraea biroi]
MAVHHSPIRGTEADVSTDHLASGGSPLVEAGSVPAQTRSLRSAGRLQETFVAEFRNVRLPTFWKKRPALWFIQLESEFTAYRVHSDDIKFSAIIRHLDEETMTAVADALESPPASDKYTHLKSVLIERFTDSQEKQLRKLLLGIELGEKKPSVLLREMRTLSGANATDGLLRTLWIQRLPERIQELLTMFDEASLTKLADCADKAWEHSTHSVATTLNVTPSDNALQTLTQQVQELIKSVTALQTRDRDESSKWKLSRSRQRSTNRSKTPQRGGECYYHRRFGNKARKCEPLCSAQPAIADAANKGNE